MTSDLDIYRSANLLIKQHGEDAPIEAAMRADTMLEAWRPKRLRSVEAHPAGGEGISGDGA